MTQRAPLFEVEASRAFDATRRFEELSFYHVPFDRLNGDERTETALARQITNSGRVVLVGHSGSGKSSVISSVFGPFATALPENFVPLRVPVAAEQDATVTEPGALARHLVLYITRWASRERFSEAEQQDFERGVAEVTRRAKGQKTRQYHVGLPIWLADVSLAQEVQSAGEDYETHSSASDAVERLKLMLVLFASHNLAPVIVFDDSDTWLRIAGLDRTEVANAFFMKSVRMMSKELDASFVLAVHNDYLPLAGYKEASQLLSGEIHIPRLENPQSDVETILRDRLVAAEVASDLGEVIEPEAVRLLAEHYARDRTIRDVLRVVQRAMQHALSDSIELVGPQLIEQSITELYGP